ncbi:MAG: 16S rRNA methyltransferase GidB [Methanosaeta sp. PtaU1.Bin112]|nr:MAG: 16S rRNA methyltransferase GidB [Methanosaeta sp. PtaU1.Bin112]
MQTNVYNAEMVSRDVDWNSVWKTLYEKNAECRGRGDCASIWATRDRARAFLAQSQERPERILKDIEGLPLKADSKVLDIGAGPGTLAVPLAARVAHVTAVEPAAGMAEVMSEHAREKGVTNLSIVRKRWEDVDYSKDLQGPYDIVIARHSLGMPNIRDAVKAMCEASSEWVYLFWFAGSTGWEKAMVDLWPKLHGREYRSGPKADILYNVLYSMGIYPNMETVQMEYARKFSDINAAVKEFREQYLISSPAQEEVLREHLQKSLSRTGDGLQDSMMTRQVRFWWNVNQHNQLLQEY